MPKTKTKKTLPVRPHKPVKEVSEPLTEKEEMKRDLSVASAIAEVSTSRGGIIVQESLTDDIVSLVSSLAAKYKSATHIELVVMCADLKTKLDMLRVFSRAPKNREFLVELLGDALKE